MVRAVRLLVAAGGALAALVVGELLRAAYRRDLPWFEGSDISGTMGEPDRPLYRVVVLGDSTVTAPGVADADTTWVRIVARELSGTRFVELTSLAAGGATTGDVLSRQAPEAAALDPDLVIISAGGNDVIRRVPPATIERNVGAVLDALAGDGVRIVVVGPADLGTIPRVSSPADRVLSWASVRAHEAIRRAASSRDGVVFVDVLGRSTILGVHPQFFAADGFHPGEGAHRLLASTILRDLAAAGIIEPGDASSLDGGSSRTGSGAGRTEAAEALVDGVGAVGGEPRAAVLPPRRPLRLDDGVEGGAVEEALEGPAAGELLLGDREDARRVRRARRLPDPPLDGDDGTLPDGSGEGPEGGGPRPRLVDGEEDRDAAPDVAETGDEPGEGAPVTLVGVGEAGDAGELARAPGGNDLVTGGGESGDGPVGHRPPGDEDLRFVPSHPGGEAPGEKDPEDRCRHTPIMTDADAGPDGP